MYGRKKYIETMEFIESVIKVILSQQTEIMHETQATYTIIKD